MVALEKVETELILETVPKARRSMVELPRLDKMEVIEHVEENRGGVGVDVVELAAAFLGRWVARNEREFIVL